MIALYTTALIVNTALGVCLIIVFIKNCERW